MEIKIENLKKIYGQNTVINIPELTLHNGELVGLWAIMVRGRPH